MSKAFLADPAFAEYARLLFRLHGLVATEAGDSSEADELRAQMDSGWARLSASERDDLRKLSERLYAFHEEAESEVARV